MRHHLGGQRSGTAAPRHPARSAVRPILLYQSSCERPSHTPASATAGTPSSGIGTPRTWKKSPCVRRSSNVHSLDVCHNLELKPSSLKIYLHNGKLNLRSSPAEERHISTHMSSTIVISSWNVPHYHMVLWARVRPLRRPAVNITRKVPSLAARRRYERLKMPRMDFLCRPGVVAPVVLESESEAPSI